VVFDLEDDWVWDFWTFRPPGEPHHAFFLKAPRSLGDPDLRHRSARVGHAISEDLRSWTRLPDPLTGGPGPHDSLATWTGCAVSDQGTAWLFSSGLSVVEDGRIQRIGAAVSQDLLTWRSTGRLLEADPRWYLVPQQGEVHWRDPCVVRDDGGTWHMYLTAKVGGERGNGVVGHATSTDLKAWEVHPPLGPANGVFDQLEVISLARVQGRWVLVFSCLGPEIVGGHEGAGGVWSVLVDGPGAPVDLDAATRVTSEDLYVGRVVEHEQGAVLLAFRNRDARGSFVGGITDPIPIRLRDDGLGIEIDASADVPQSWRPSRSAPGMAG
jgi:beta-fructofuranosidase